MSILQYVWAFWMYPSVDCLFTPIVHSPGVSVSSFMVCTCFFYNVNKNPLSVLDVTNIFSNFVICLLILPYIDQKFLLLE